MTTLPPPSDSIVIVNKNLNWLSKQVEDQTLKGVINPPISFYSLLKAYDNSFILGGIFDKLSTAGNSGFKLTGNKELDSVLRKLDIKYVLENILVFGNAFIEKVLDGRGKVVELSPILTYTMSAWLMGDIFGYVQRVSGKEQFFLSEELVHCKTMSMVSRYYGNSKFAKTVDQIVLLSQIDQYYGGLFDGGMIGADILMDKGDATGKKLSDENRTKLGEYLKDNMGWVKNAGSSVIVPTWLEKLDLSKDVNTEAFLKYRQDLIESIAIGLNIPVDLLSPKNSNRSTADVAYKALNSIIVKPMQDSLIQDLQEQLRENFGDMVDLIEINSSDAGDEKKDMEVDTGYKKAGIMTANEVRKKLGLDPMPGGDVLMVDTAPTPNTSSSDILKEIQDIQKSFENSLYGKE